MPHPSHDEQTKLIKEITRRENLISKLNNPLLNITIHAPHQILDIHASHRFAIHRDEFVASIQGALWKEIDQLQAQLDIIQLSL